MITVMQRLAHTKDNTARLFDIVGKKWKDCPAYSEAQSALGFAQNNGGFQTQK
jgi:hypothetical protein